MSRRLGPVLAILAVMSAVACEDDPDDLDYLKAGAGGSTTATASGGKGGSTASAGKGGTSAAGHSSDVDAGD